MNMIAMVYMAEGKNAIAKKELNKALIKFPADPDTSHNLARILIREKDLDGAKKLYEKVVEKDGGNLTALNQLAIIAAREGNGEKMLSLLEAAQEKNPNQLSARLQLANQYIKRSQSNSAIQTLNNASAEDKQKTSYILVMAYAKIAANEPAHAVRALKSLVKKHSLPGAHFLLARAYGIQKKPKIMRKSLENTLLISPEHLGAGLVIARLDLIEGKYGDFKKRISQLVKIYPENADVKFLKAKADSGDKNYAEAIGTLSDILERTPNTNVAIDLARNQWQSGDHDGALSGLEIWIQENPDDNRVKFELAQLFLADQKNTEAIAAYEELIKSIPDNHIVLNNRAWLLTDIDTGKAIQYGERALMLKPESPLIKDTVAMLYLKAGDLQKALELSSQAATEAPNIFDIQINYSKVLNANGEAEQARAVLLQLQTNTPDREKKKLIAKELEGL
jgi:putative PEP-CTERM system TPR-repeat lipoprotein